MFEQAERNRAIVTPGCKECRRSSDEEAEEHKEPHFV